MEPIQITALTDLIEWNFKNTTLNGKEERFLFRGVSKSEYKLLPKISRPKNDTSGNVELRIKILKDYLKIHLPAYGYNFEKLDKNQREWQEIFIAQHYGVATNLLDFTRNPLVAAFFATYKHPESDSKIYAIRIQEQDWKNEDYDMMCFNHNIASFDYLDSPFELKRTIFVVPPHIDKRIQAQIGVFCCFSRENDLVPLNEQKEFNGKRSDEAGYIQEFVIKKESKETIMKELNKLGINHMSLFPDMNGFGEFVTWKLLDIL